MAEQLTLIRPVVPCNGVWPKPRTRCGALLAVLWDRAEHGGRADLGGLYHRAGARVWDLEKHGFGIAHRLDPVRRFALYRLTRVPADAPAVDGAYIFAALHGLAMGGTYEC